MVAYELLSMHDRKYDETWNIFQFETFDEAEGRADTVVLRYNL